MIVALAGRPNTGKTTLFNALTGLRQRVANFAGCTVEKAVGQASWGSGDMEVVDLPGTFSILAHAEDEKVAFKFMAQCLSSARPFQVVCVTEASNLVNDLPLALSLKGCGYPVILAVNMMDEAALNGVVIDKPRLEEELGVPVFLISARNGTGMTELKSFLAEACAARPSGRDFLDLSAASVAELVSIQEESQALAWAALARAVRMPPSANWKTLSQSIRLDRWLFHPFLGPLALGAALFLVFQSLFALGAPARDFIASGLASFSNALRPVLPGELLASLVCDGIIAGVSAVATFIPQIAILFVLIGILEQSGYLPRAGAMVDRALRPFGLDGKVFIPFLSSFACAIPGVMATRTIANKKRRLTAILLAPLMTCSARIPVYTLIIAAFVPSSCRIMGFNAQGLVMSGMYAFGIVAALLMALALRGTPLYEAHPSPLTPLPPYRLPRAKELFRYVWVRCWHFLGKAGKVIFVLSLALWTLASFPRSEKAVAPMRRGIELAQSLPGPAREARVRELKARMAAVTIENSLLGRLGRAVEPLFKPIGYDWRLSVAVISSLAAREVFVGTLGTLFALSGEGSSPQGLVEALRNSRTPDGSPRYGLATAVSLLFFFAIALQCVSTIVVVERETGSWKWPALQFCAFFALAYSMSWAGYHATKLFLQ
ncbi:MAG: ferrous iron transporter B [Elusimicrobia bacterium]|nr:ferrous iron transporter B [Elusimicrobiota bacterium]